MKTVFIVLIITTMLQSCHGFDNTSTNMVNASYRGWVKVTTKDGKKYKFINIESLGENYYGVKRGFKIIDDPYLGKHRIWQKKIPLDTALISGIYLEDIDKSKRQTALAPVGFVVIMLLAVLVSL